MRWLLDTNVVSETVRGNPDRAVLSWIARQPDDLTAISVVTLAELESGLLSTVDQKKRDSLSRWLEGTVMPWIGQRTLPLSLKILTDWVQLGRILAAKGMTRNPADLLIASTARIHDLILVSRNSRDFAGTGVVIYDPWKDKTHRTESV